MRIIRIESRSTRWSMKPGSADIILSVCYKKGTHLPPHAYQNLLRINHAKKELKKRRSIAEIAVDAGYYDQSHFIKAFAKIVGATPQAYAISV